jgi:hypothetical protein
LGALVVLSLARAAADWLFGDGDGGVARIELPSVYVPEAI